MMNFERLKQFAFLVGVIAIVGSVMALVVQELQSDIETDYGTNTTAYTVTQDGLDGLSGLTGTLDIIGLIAGFAVLIGIVTAFGYGFYQRYN